MANQFDPDPVIRFWSHVEKTETCWLWKDALQSRGYGTFQVNGSTVFAHRFSWELHRGPIPQELTIDHLCRVKRCVNPNHLEPVTSQENVLRGDTLPARNIHKRFCPAGHEYTEENTRISQGKRQCRICDRAYDKRRREANRALGLPPTFRGRA